MPALILNDLARCHGDFQSAICTRCARLLQMDFDDIRRQYPHISKRPTTKTSCDTFLHPRERSAHV